MAGRNRKTGLLFDPTYGQHNPGPGHPESPDRYTVLERHWQTLGLLDRLPRIGARRATEDEILLCHTLPYWRTVQEDTARGALTLSTGDTAMGPNSLDIALLAAGGVLATVDAVFAGEVENAFAVVRPPGHHATASRGMGFCFFNNAAIAARYAQQRYGVERVLIVDWDVHHGNGTQDIFYSDPSVFFLSTHQSPWYPGTGAVDETGEDRGRGTTLNRPLPAGSGREVILPVYGRTLRDEMRNYRPDFVLISAGFDSRSGDPLGQFQLADPDFVELTSILLEVADVHCGGRLVSVLEGGYSLIGLPAAATAHLQTLQQS